MLLNKKDSVKFSKIKEDWYYPKVKQSPKMNDFYDPIYFKMFVKIDLGFILNDVLNIIFLTRLKVKEFRSRVKWENLRYYPKQKNELLRNILSQKKEISKSSEKN